MKKISCLAVLAATACLSLGQDLYGGRLALVDQFKIGTAEQHVSQTTLVAYSNVSNYTGLAFSHGRAAEQNGNTITRLIADDVTPTGLSGDVASFQFSVANLGGLSTLARARVRFWNDDGSGGVPGSYYSNPAAVGFTFEPLEFASGAVTVVSATIPLGTFSMPTARFWAGLTFDDNNGSTGASLEQLNNLGQGIFDPPTIGTSADTMFVTYAEGSFFGVDNPEGGLTNFGGDPRANLGWEFEVVPEPTSVLILAFGLGVLNKASRKHATIKKRR